MSGSDAVLKIGNSNSYDSSYSTPCGNSNCGRVRIHYVKNGSNGYLPSALYLYTSECTSLRNVSISTESRALGSGTPSVVAPGSMKTLKVYIAAKGLSETDELARRVVVQASVPGADASERTALSCASGRWTEDTSTWIGESGLTAFALEMPLEILAACTVDVKIHFRWYSASGYLYIDPGIAIE